MKKLFPHQALNAAYRRIQIEHDSYTNFLKGLDALVSNIKEEGQDERNQRDLLIKFFNNTLYKDHMVTGEGDIDVVIKSDTSSDSNVVVMFEIKGLGRPDMPTEDNLNTKALHELILYYMRQRDKGNADIRNLIVTNTREFFIFDAKEFERLFYHNSAFKKKFKEFEFGASSSNKTDKDRAEYFYKEIAKPEVEKVQDDLEFTYFSLKDYKRDIENKATTGALPNIYRLLNKPHLLKSKFQNDSNSLDEKFYKELLHLIGLEEVKENSKTVIRRKAESKRSKASLFENTLDELRIHNRQLSPSYGDTYEERLFNVAMELCVTWINRILFLKLLEAQLINYHHDKESYKFLTYDKIKDFNKLNSLFFKVMAVEPDKRDENYKSLFPNVPYLNSSLFEQTELERQCFDIYALSSEYELPLLSKSVLRNDYRFRKKKSLPFLEYLFEFLDAYNFSSEGTGDVAEKPKTLINASVLGLIFEKINGYKDGSVYTPGFITRYMCKNAIRQAVLQKFNVKYGCNLKNFDEIKNADYDKKEVNELINSLKICDPAVGSGHFLVSALNEIILIKAELKCLFDTEGNRIRPDDYEISVENDELIITYSDSPNENEIWRYKPGYTESNRIQEALFNEKRIIIENCLFGVDINPNSVNICRLRLWIELLKNAYYTKESNRKQLETLPNIDINIKCGNSLLYKFKSDSILSGKDIPKYKSAVRRYKRTKDKEDKFTIDRSIDKLKKSLSAEIMDWMNVKIDFVEAEKVYNTLLHPRMFDDERTSKEIRSYAKQLKNAKKDLDIKKKALDDAINNRIFGNGFEWRVEFPEILNEKGEFVGFDLIIGNPPYGVSIKDDLRTIIVKNLGKVPDYEIYYFFIQLAKIIVKKNGIISLIVPNTFLFNQFAANYRLNLFKQWKMDEILDLTKIPIFQTAVVRNAIISWTAVELNEEEETYDVGYKCTRDASDFSDLISREKQYITEKEVEKYNQNWGLVFYLPPEIIKLCNKISDIGTYLTDLYDVSQGYIPYRKSDLIKLYGEQEASLMVKNRVWHSDNKKDENYIQEIYGQDITKYNYHPTGRYVNYGRHVASYVDLKFFTGERILIREITNPQIIACKVYEQYVNDPQLISIIKKSNTADLDVLWAILNSKLATFYHFNHSPKATKGLFPKILIQDLKDFPLPEIPKKITEILKSKVKEIIELKRVDPQYDTSQLENEIDHIVYHLYGLTYDEVLIIDPQTPFPREEYDILDMENVR